MALPALDTITTMAIMRQYALAEASDAQSKCPAVYNNYMKAVQILDSYATFKGTALEITYVELARQAIKDARTAWYAAGCKDPNATTSASAASKTVAPVIAPTATAQGALGFGGIGKFLLVGGALFAAMLIFSKKPTKKTTKKRTTKKRTTKRRSVKRRYRRR